MSGSPRFIPGVANSTGHDKDVVHGRWYPGTTVGGADLDAVSAGGLS